MVAFLSGFKSERPGPALRQFTLEHLENCYRAHRHIYTDGFVTSTSSASRAWIPSANVTISATLSHCTSYTANEQVALRAVINYNVDWTAESWVTFTDSRAALKSLRSPCTQDQLATGIKLLCKKACDLHHRIVLQWIPSHCGIQCNARADDASKAWHDTSAEIIEIPFSRQDAAMIVSEHAWRLQLSLWTHPSQQYGPVYKIDPSCDFRMP
ncbi:hypothetical protein HPB51_027728 [Rhipicephalus microplus]|uniref:RNase H type-1 domain-containing protein n=1 Tax=Rhipicephalus microplus TaxID=6941 RepID=A0A9J6CZH5_RHIMP|nr:hypothetical protein HPB51_027728 [Rhipicephalus microplus]